MMVQFPGCLLEASWHRNRSGQGTSFHTGSALRPDTDAELPSSDPPGRIPLTSALLLMLPSVLSLTSVSVLSPALERSYWAGLAGHSQTRSAQFPVPQRARTYQTREPCAPPASCLPVSSAECPCWTGRDSEPGGLQDCSPDPTRADDQKRALAPARVAASHCVQTGGSSSCHPPTTLRALLLVLGLCSQNSAGNAVGSPGSASSHLPHFQHLGTCFLVLPSRVFSGSVVRLETS